MKYFSVYFVLFYSIISYNAADHCCKDDFIFLGRAENPVIDLQKRVIGGVRASSYYLSKKAISWKEASRTCRGVYGGDSTLLYVESEDELENVNVFFDQTPDTGYRYWTGGRYNSTANRFMWGNTRVPFGDHMVWDNGHPNLGSNDTTQIRVAMKRYRQDARVQTDDSNKYLRYICEVP